MKKNNIAFILFLFVFAGCSQPCVEPRGIEGAGLNITFFNSANNEYFYPENTTLSPYSIDSLRVKDSYGNLLTTPHSINQDPVNPLKRFYVVQIYPIFIPAYDQGAFDTEQVKFIYIKYNFNTCDTIKLLYKARREKCANSYEYLRAYYKNSLIGETSDSYSQGLLFNLNH